MARTIGIGGGMTLNCCCCSSRRSARDEFIFRCQTGRIKESFHHRGLSRHSLSVCRPPQGLVPFLCGRGPAAVGGTRCTQGPWGGARVHAPSGTAIAGPRQYPSGSGTSGPGRAGWLPGGKQCRWCSKETRPRRSHVPLLPGEDGKKSGSKEA